jgi:hypothetical protein
LPPVSPPDWIGRVLRGLTALLVLAFAAGATFAAVVVPYRLWDSLAFGSWSRSIAEGNGLWEGAPALYLQRPLVYVSQGLAWRVLGDDEWIGRLLSLSFAALLVVAVWLLARELTADGEARLFLPALAVGLVLGSSVSATYAAAGMTDVPVAGLVAATGAALWRRRPNALLVAALASAAVLAKPSALLALGGLAAAVLVLRGKGGGRSVAALAAGVAAALVYDLWQASRIDVAFFDLLTAGNDEFWVERGEAARWDALARADWLGESLRLLVLFGLAHAAARVAGARARTALGLAAAVAIAWSVAGPVVADGSVPYPLDGSVLGIAAWIVLACALAGAALVATDDPIGRRTHAALLVWLAPTALTWAWQRADEVRLLAPAWAPLVLVAAAALASVSVALARFRPAAGLAPAAAVAVLALANLPSIDGLGRDGWRDLLDLGPSGWSDRAAMENYAYGPFSYELELARENVGEGERIVTSNGRLAYFFPGRVDFRYARTCSELAGARFFSYLEAGESLEFASRAGQPTDALGWVQCPDPTLELVGEQPGIYAAFVVGGPPARAPLPEDCHIATSPGQLVDAVFGSELSYAAAKSLLERALAVGFEGTRIERTGCSRFRVVVSGVPEDTRVQREFSAQAERVGLPVDLIPAMRYPEVSPEVAAVR